MRRMQTWQRETPRQLPACEKNEGEESSETFKIVGYFVKIMDVYQIPSIPRLVTSSQSNLRGLFFKFKVILAQQTISSVCKNKQLAIDHHRDRSYCLQWSLDVVCSLQF